MKISMKKMNLHQGNLILVNSQHSIKEDNVRLQKVDSSYAQVLLHPQAAQALRRTLEKIGAKEKIIPISGYRSVAEQERTKRVSLEKHGKDFTKQFVARPYHSEHHTGFAIDLGVHQEVIDEICPSFPYDGISKEFRKHASSYGFVERYPKGKEQITGISHEPWHFRFVGFPHSLIMEQMGFVLEEYLSYLKSFDERSPLVFKTEKKEIYRIYYVKEKSQIEIPEGLSFSLSGNNMDGFILTLWKNKSIA